MQAIRMRTRSSACGCQRRAPNLLALRQRSQRHSPIIALFLYGLGLEAEEGSRGGEFGSLWWRGSGRGRRSSSSAGREGDSSDSIQVGVGEDDGDGDDERGAGSVRWCGPTSRSESGGKLFLRRKMKVHRVG